MSTWTHVVGCIRVDGIPGLSQDKAAIERILGPMCLYNAWNEASTLPRGSEGSLQYKIIEYYGGLPWLAIPIWGDLRDFESVKPIEDWFRETLAKIQLVRDAVIHAAVEDLEVLTLTHREVKTDG